MTEPKEVSGTTPPSRYRVDAGGSMYARAARLYEASYALYMAAGWSTDELTEDEQRKLWEALRDALDLPTGTFTATRPTHECCWHTTSGLTSTSLPPRISEVCCHCGVRRDRTLTPPIPEGHGPHYPHYPHQLPTITTWTGGTSKFVDRTANCPCRPENGGSGICGCVLSSPTWHKTDG